MKQNRFFAAVLFVVVFSCTTFNARAQYYDSPYAPGGTAWCLQMENELAQMAYQRQMVYQYVQDYYHQQAQFSGQQLQNFVANPMPYVQANGYTAPQTPRNSKVEVPCSHCSGGYNTRYLYMNGECREVTSRCSWCHGTGYVKEY